MARHLVSARSGIGDSRGLPIPRPGCVGSGEAPWMRLGSSG